MPKPKEYGKLGDVHIRDLGLLGRLHKTDDLDYTAVTFRKKLFKTKQLGF